MDPWKPNVPAMKIVFNLIALLMLSCGLPSDEATTATAEPAGMSGAVDSVVAHPIFHASLVLQHGGLTIYVDPYDGAERFAAFPAPDLVLITDIHPDHFDPSTLNGLPLDKARIVAPPSVKEQLPEALRSECVAMPNGHTLDIRGVHIEAVPMYNLPPSPKAMHPPGRGNGYVLTMGGDRIYISGDTQGIPEMRALKDIDIALVCMNLPYTMDVDEAADAVLAFKPKVVYPYHFRGAEGFSDVQRFKELVNEKDPAIDVRLVDWYPAK